MRRTFWMSLAVPAVVLVGCSDTSRLAGPRVPGSDALRPNAQILDAAHSGGSAGFYLLPPLVAQPNDSAAFDPNRSVSVSVCPLGNPAASSCQGPSVMISPVEVDVVGAHYMVNWQTDPTVFPANSYYRVMARDNGTQGEWGHVDVYLGATGQGFRSINQSEFTPLLDGRTVPVKFRIDVNAQTPPPPNGGNSGGGSVNF